MKKFITNIIAFTLLLIVLFEITIRVLHLVSDIPQREVDKFGIQRYKKNQSGYYSGGKNRWEVNKYGWLGVSETKLNNTVSIIGDSYIENIMNPIECNQGIKLKKYFPNYAFFEAGRSGVTFIEAMEIGKILNTEIEPIHQLLYLSDDDFYESISEISRYKDRLQISLEQKEILKAKIKNAKLKKILYNFKLLYYIYTKSSIFIAKRDKVETTTIKENQFDNTKFEQLFNFCLENYECEKLIFVFHPNSNNDIIEMAKKYGIKTIVLDSKGDSPWILGKHDGHWSCFGHTQVSKQVKTGFKKYISN